jgi:transposase
MKRKHPGGRPTSYRPEFCRGIVALMAEGRSLEGCAALLGVHPDSLYEWQKVHPEFSEAVRAGRAAATTFWENRLLGVANGEPGNAQAIQWALRNRSRAASGWHHDSLRFEHSSPEGGPIGLNVPAPGTHRIDVAQLSPEHREGLKAALLAAVALPPKSED